MVFGLIVIDNIMRVLIPIVVLSVGAIGILFRHGWSPPRECIGERVIGVGVRILLRSNRCCCVI